jgi:hypothetical protein
MMARGLEHVVGYFLGLWVAGVHHGAQLLEVGASIGHLKFRCECLQVGVNLRACHIAVTETAASVSPGDYRRGCFWARTCLVRICLK